MQRCVNNITWLPKDPTLCLWLAVTQSQCTLRTCHFTFPLGANFWQVVTLFHSIVKVLIRSTEKIVPWETSIGPGSRAGEKVSNQSPELELTVCFITSDSDWSVVQPWPDTVRLCNCRFKCSMWDVCPVSLGLPNLSWWLWLWKLTHVPYLLISVHMLPLTFTLCPWRKQFLWQQDLSTNNISSFLKVTIIVHWKKDSFLKLGLLLFISQLAAHGEKTQMDKLQWMDAFKKI